MARLPKRPGTIDPGLLAEPPNERYGTRLAGWLDIFVTVTVIFPAVSRLADRAFSLPDVLLVAAGGVRLVFWTVRLVLSAEARNPGPSGQNR
ncbi:hypothetical protein QFZ69_004656 [Arthrobacter sp. V1I7]|nr:hypothetical protein [Arthrobacter sp. V1I7]